MADEHETVTTTPQLEAGYESGAVSADVALPGRPRWVKVFLFVAALLVVAFLAAHLGGFGGGPGQHSPGRHGETPTTEAVESHQPRDHTP